MPPLDETIATLKMLHRKRCFAMDQRKRCDLSLGAFLRTALGWSLALPKDERDAIAKQAAAYIALGNRLYKAGEGEAPEDFDPWKDIVFSMLLSRDPWDEIERDTTQEMERLAKALPVWAWAEGVRGFGAVSLAVIVGECGDLADYAGPYKLNKRLGLAVFDGVRQGGLSKNAPKEQWIAHGYSPVRRARMWVIGDCLKKGNGDGKYRTMYLRRLAMEHKKAVAEGLIPATSTAATVQSWAARGLPPLEKITKIDPAKHRSAGHMDRRAQRYMEKKFLRDLWCAWNHKPVYENGRPEFSLPVAAE